MSGEYVVLLSGSRGDSLPIDASFKIWNSPESTAAMTFDTVFNGNLSIPGEVDTYTFNGTIGQQFFFDLRNVPFSYSITGPSGTSYSLNDGAFALKETGVHKLSITPTSFQIRLELIRSLRRISRPLPRCIGSFNQWNDRCSESCPILPIQRDQRPVSLS